MFWIIENELSTYVSHTSEIAKVLKALSLKRRPDVEDLTYYDKWVNTYSFDPENIVYAAKASKKNSVKKLEGEFLKEGYYISNYKPNIYLIHPMLYND